MKIDPNSPTFPNPQLGISHFNDPGAYPGIPIRLHLAAMAMQGLLANSAREGTPKDFAYDSLQHADVLIAEYNRTETKP